MTVTTITRAAIVAEARSWVGTPWRHQGRTREGVDCAGLIVKVAHGLGVSDFDRRDYERIASDESMRETCAEHMTPIELNELAPGDVVVMNLQQQRHIAFLGDYTGGRLSLIHALGPKHPSRVAEHRMDLAWRAKIMSAYRFPGVL